PPRGRERPAPPRPGPAGPGPSPASKCSTLPRVETPGPWPGSGGRRPAPAPLTPHDGSNAARRPGTGSPPDYRDGPAPGPEAVPPDSVVGPALENPDTRARWPH